jgi:DNA modification methylase
MTSMPTLPTQIELLPTELLVPYARNARTHSDAQVAQLAAAMQEFGWTNPVLIGENNDIIAGHGRVLAARSLGLSVVPCIRLAHLSETQKRALVLADNKLGLNSGWDEQILADELAALEGLGFDLDLAGFAAQEIDDLFAEHGHTTAPAGAADAVPEADTSRPPVSRPGDLWVCGRHRVLCGDSTSAADVARLMAGQKAALLHADPPYGMGKEADGVAGDNQYGENLDRFQMQWWRAFRPHLVDNASAYVWGNAESLWRLWYVGGLRDSERLTLRNEIVWNKISNFGQMSADLRCYAPAGGERALFFMLGQQAFGNINIEDYWEGWEPFRLYLVAEAEKMGWGAKDIKDLCGVGMWGHWFTKSQWTLIPEKHYQTLQAAAAGRAFGKSYAELKNGTAEARASGSHLDVKREFDAMRAYFDNTHDNMTDVWSFSRVTGDERHDHATPKPVAMMERALRSSLRPGELCAEPFGGSGSTLMGAEVSGRACYTMELQPYYCDVIVRRWQQYTGAEAVLEGDGRRFAAIEAEPRA